jgi:hypothetical protein
MKRRSTAIEPVSAKPGGMISAWPASSQIEPDELRKVLTGVYSG